MIPTLTNGWKDVQADPRCSAHGRRLLNSVARYDREAGKLVKYLAEFVLLKCAPDLLALRVFPNGKEISESFAAYDAVRYRLPQFRLDDPAVTVVCVGDGRTPRTAATFALRSAWTVYSVDPLLRGGKRRWSAIRRLRPLVDRIENVRIAAERVILVAVHSHAKLPPSVAAIAARELAVVAMPCCVVQELARRPDLEYVDKGVISPARTIKIWRDVAAAAPA